MTEDRFALMEANETDDVVAQAADWVTRIQSGEVHAQDCSELKLWLATDKAHAQTFARMIKVFDLSSSLAQPAQAGVTHPRRRAHSRQRLAGFAAAAFAASLLIGVMLFPLLSGESIETSTGERRLVQLEDGSNVHLNAESMLRVSFDGSHRYARLERGEAHFDIASDSARPFSVDVGDATVLVTGTSFQITRYDNTMTAVVLEGSVSIEVLGKARSSNNGAELYALQAGEGLSIQDSGVRQFSGFDARRVTGWRDGWLYLDDVPLRELVNRLNRQYDGEIRVDNATLADTHISVALRLQGREQTLERLQTLLPVRIRSMPGDRYIVEPAR